MYRWYRDAHVCFVHLSDVSLAEIRNSAAQDLVEGSQFPKNHLPLFRSSEWFCRGWTLQELIAPRFIVFFNAEWRVLGKIDPDDILYDVRKMPIKCEEILSNNPLLVMKRLNLLPH